MLALVSGQRRVLARIGRSGAREEHHRQCAGIILDSRTLSHRAAFDAFLHDSLLTLKGAPDMRTFARQFATRARYSDIQIARPVSSSPAAKIS